MRVRLAPSLAGPLTVGAARPVLATWLLARRAHGQPAGHVTLRLDDLDQRDAAHAEATTADLRWLGLDWDEVARQDSRRARYAEIAAQLERAGRLYPCFESEAELRSKREARLRRHLPARYDRAMLGLTPAQRAAAEAGGKRPYFRFRLSDVTVAWNDAVLGRTPVDVFSMSDPVLIRPDGTPLPLFAAVVDDIDAGISHVVQSDELRGASAIMLDLRAALGAARLEFFHIAPLPEGPTLRRLRGDGIEPAALIASLLHTNDAPGPPETLDLAALPEKLDIDRLRALNHATLRASPFADVADRLPAGATEAFWLAIRDNLDLLNEARGWWDVVAGTIVPPVIEGQADILRAALALLPAEPWTGHVWQTWTAALTDATGHDGTETLRLALTGEEHGPDMATLLPLIGRPRAAQRLKMAAA